MTQVIDTSAWIEWLIDGPIAGDLSARMHPVHEIVVPTIVQLELAKWLNREMDESAADEIIAHTITCRVATLDTGIALMAADFCRQFGLATADAIVLATARANKAELLTCDAHFDGLEGVSLVRKK